MKKSDWFKLCKNIYEKKCILLIGPEFPLERTTGAAIENTTFSNLISERLVEELSGHSRIPDEIKKSLALKETAQLAGDYMKYTESNKMTSRGNLEEIIFEHLLEIDNSIKSASFSKLATLPFPVLIDTNYGNFFYNELAKNLTPNKAYYNFKGQTISLVESFSQDSLGSELSPFVYNLFGSIENLGSLVLSENELIDFVINLISKNPGLPANVKSELADPNRYFLFLGFGIFARNWYFRILLQALESSNKGSSMSYALEQIDNIGNDDDPTIVFFRDELKLSLYNYDQHNFIDDLIVYYDQYKQKMEKLIHEEPVLEGAPKAFISYKSEDYDKAQQIFHRLRKSGVDAWLDQRRLKGMWESSVEDEINSTDAFILLQSSSLFRSGENYVHDEIKTALKRAKRFQDMSDFIYPTFIDSREFILKKPPELLAINSYDLTNLETDLLAKDIKRTYERKRNKAA